MGWAGAWGSGMNGTRFPLPSHLLWFCGRLVGAGGSPPCPGAPGIPIPAQGPADSQGEGKGTEGKAGKKSLPSQRLDFLCTEHK